MGIRSLVAKLRQAVFCRDKGQLEIAVREICAECEGCSLSKQVDHRTGFGPITLPAEPGQVVGVDQTMGCTNPHGDVQDSFPRTPFVLSVTDKRTSYTAFEAMPDASAKAVLSAFKHMLSLLGIGDKVQEVWTDNGKQFLSAEFAALLRSALPGVRHCRIPPYAPGGRMV